MIILLDIRINASILKDFIVCKNNLKWLISMLHVAWYKAWKLYERSKMIDLIDPRMQKDGFSVKDVMKTIHVALLCLQPLPNMRPAMSEIVAMLTWKVEMIKSPIKPTFLDRRSRKNDEIVSWETISNDFPSPLETESPSLTQPPNSREFDVKGEVIVWNCWFKHQRFTKRYASVIVLLDYPKRNWLFDEPWGRSLFIFFFLKHTYISRRKTHL